VALRAQQPPATTPTAAPAPAGRPIVPIAASTLAENPDRYIGEQVSLAGAVDQHLTKLAFSVDQDKTKRTAKEILVLAKYLESAVDLNTYVTVIGEVVRFDPDEVARKAKDYLPELPQPALEGYRGRPAILATSVITTGGVDLARRPPPPLTPAEEAFDKVMKQVGAANRALRTALDESDAKAAQENARLLQQGFKQSAAFWKTRRVAEATGWSQDGLKLAESIHRAAVAGRWDEVKETVGTLGKVCQTCHTAHRDRLDDGTFRIKP
jgi:cytochrome c556